MLAELSQVSVARGGRTVLTDVSLTVSAGEVVAVVGPNGAGKSTLVSVLAGDLAPVSGSVTVDGRPVGRWRPKELAMRRSVLPQHAAVAFPFTVAQVVAMGRAPWARTSSAAEDEQAVADAILMRCFMPLE